MTDICICTHPRTSHEVERDRYRTVVACCDCPCTNYTHPKYLEETA